MDSSHHLCKREDTIVINTQKRTSNVKPALILSRVPFLHKKSLPDFTPTSPHSLSQPPFLSPFRIVQSHAHLSSPLSRPSLGDSTKDLLVNMLAAGRVFNCLHPRVISIYILKTISGQNKIIVRAYLSHTCVNNEWGNHQRKLKSPPY